MAWRTLWPISFKDQRNPRTPNVEFEPITFEISNFRL